jgi:hypothetical protein
MPILVSASQCSIVLVPLRYGSQQGHHANEGHRRVGWTRVSLRMACTGRIAPCGQGVTWIQLRDVTVHRGQLNVGTLHYPLSQLDLASALLYHLYSVLGQVLQILLPLRQDEAVLAFIALTA